MDSRKKIFISYSWKDQDEARQIRNAIPEEFDVWMDVEQMKPGAPIAQVLEKALSGSDYYLLLISENSNTSSWVKRELSYAFELAAGKKLSVVPFLLKQAEIPFEMKGLMYIDARPSLAKGIEDLRKFFRGQLDSVSMLDPRVIIRKSSDDTQMRQRACTQFLSAMELGDLRYHLASRLGIEEVEVVWFDLFNRRMQDEVQVRNLALSLVELLERSRREEQLPRLVDILCRTMPRLGPR